MSNPGPHSEVAGARYIFCSLSVGRSLLTRIMPVLPFATMDLPLTGPDAFLSCCALLFLDPA